MGSKPSNSAVNLPKQSNIKSTLINVERACESLQQDICMRSEGNIYLQEFYSLDLSFEKQRHVRVEATQQKKFQIFKYFKELPDLQAYISNLIKLKKIANIDIYDQVVCETSESPYYTTLTMYVSDYRSLTFSAIQSQQLQKKLRLLIFISSVLSKVQRIFIDPSCIIDSNQGYHLINFAYSNEYTSEEIFLAFMRWMFKENQSFQQCLQQNPEVPLGMPICLREIYSQLYTQKCYIDTIAGQLGQIKDKTIFLTGKTDSFYAVSYFKKIQKFARKVQWIFRKEKHQIYFYNISDCHTCHGKIIRKRKKIDIQQTHIAFDPQSLEILYVPENSKIIVRANQFEFEQSSSISDVEIKYKLPVKFKNPLLNVQNQNLMILETSLYRYNPQSNKLIQLTKKISDYIFLTENRQGMYLIVKISIDIFKNGIRVFFKNEQLVLYHTGDLQILEELSSLRMDIKAVNFCVQVYKGVYFMMANKNFWVLDLNFQCFFSFATPNQLKKLPSHQKNHSVKHSDVLFTILNQPFQVNFSSCQDGNNVSVTRDCLHIIGKIQDKPYYLRYKFIHRMGAIKLIGYQPLFVSSQFKKINIKSHSCLSRNYHFNFHQESSNFYKYGNWIFEGDYFLKAYDIHIKWQKTNYEVNLSIEEYSETLKQYLDKLSKNKAQISRVYTVLLLYKVYKIYEHLFKNSITHKNISANSIVFTQSQQMKIHGWCQPPRNWHISDFKDYLLTCFNIITLSSQEKLTQKILNAYQVQLSQYPIFYQKLILALKQAKTIQKKVQIDKNLQLFKNYLQKQICNSFNSQVSGRRFIFSFEHKTPRCNILDIKTQKIKKILIVVQQNTNASEQFIFEESDKYQWNQQTGSLYIFTASYQFLQAKITKQSMAEQKIILQDYEYIPQNVSQNSFICTQNNGLYSFGGIKKQINNKTSFCTSVYAFNWTTLMWEVVGEIPEPRINPKLVLSSDHKQIFIVGGILEHEFEYFKPMIFDLEKSTCQLFTDRSIPTSLIPRDPLAQIFHISQEMSLFMVWFIQGTDYVVRYFSCLSMGFKNEIRIKNFFASSHISNLSVTVEGSHIHILRTYGKYTKIMMHALEGGSAKNETIYAI